MKFALFNASVALEFITIDVRLSKALHVSPSHIREFRKLLVGVNRLPEQLVQRFRLRGNSSVGRPAGSVGPTDETLYTIVRAIRPRIVVETGVAAGFSSAYLLQALHDNGFGELLSIDPPTTNPIGGPNEDGVLDGAHVAHADDTGFVIPPHLRDRWTLLLGDSKNLLPKVLSSHPLIDVFFHDSSHSYEHMLWEYRLAWSHIRPGGWLLSDDINWNRAFTDFSHEANLRPFTWGARHKGGLIHP